ncbi:MAG: PfkB family carbohydrate kinase [Candidatus Njordarchaeales archaeon]
MSRRVVVIGSYTIDEINNIIRVGGPAFFCSIVAKIMGWEPYVIGTIGEDFCQKIPFGGNLIFLPKTIRFKHSYMGEKRVSWLYTQYIQEVSWSQISYLPPKAPIILNPVINEFSLNIVDKIVSKYEWVAIDVQGFVRMVDNDGKIFLNSPGNDVLAILNDAMIVKASLEEYRVIRRMLGRIFVITLGDKGAILYDRVKRIKVYAPAYKVSGDPTGAGDAFITAFFLKLYESKDLKESISYANALASLLVEGKLISREALFCDRTRLDIEEVLMKNLYRLIFLLNERRYKILKQVSMTMHHNKLK